MKDEDIPYHIPTAFKKGDKVRGVVGVTQAHAWYADWTTRAEGLVTSGILMVVEGTDPLYGFLCGAKGRNNAWLPSCALVPARGPQSGPCIIIVPGA